MSSPSALATDTPVEARSREDELTNILLLLSSAVSRMAIPDSHLRRQLRSFDEVLDSYPGADSLKALRQNLSQALTNYAEENPTAGADSLDQATGLAGVSAFTAKIEENVSSSKTATIAVLVLDQLRALNARFGRAVGDQVLGLVAGDLAKEFGPLGELYRWNGPAFTLLANESLQTVDGLDEKVKSIATRRIEKTVNVESRSIHLKISFSWEIHMVDSGSSVTTLSRMLDDYVTSRVGTARTT